MAQHDMDSREQRSAAAYDEMSDKTADVLMGQATPDTIVRLTLDASGITGRPNTLWNAAMVFNGEKKPCDICAGKFKDYVEDEDGNVHCLKDFGIYLINEDMVVVRVHS